MTKIAVHAAERGSLHVHDRVIEKIAKAACLEVSGSTALDETFATVLGKSLPRVDAQVAGDKALLDIDVAVLWPTPVGEFAQRTREYVTDRLGRFAGVEVKRADVNIVRVERPAAAGRRVA